MGKIGLAFLAAWMLAAQALGGIVRSCVIPASECGTPEPQAGGRLVLPSFDGGTVAVALGPRTKSVTGHASFGGRSDGSTHRNATVVETPSGFVATVTDGRTRNVLVFRWNGESLRVVERAPPGRRGRCGTKAADARPKEQSAAEGAPQKAASRSSLTGNPLVDGRAMLSGETLTNVVDVLFAFDASAASWVRTASSFAGEKDALGLFAEDRVAGMNNVLENSGLGDRFSYRMAGTVEVSTDARTVRTYYGTADLDAITDYLAGVRTDSDSSRAADWKRIRSRRKDVGADIVTFLVKGAETGTVGIGFSLNDWSISDSTFPDRAYNACAITVAAYDNTIAHECGHNMGAGHASMADADNSGPQLYDYSTGHYFNVTNSEGVIIDHCMTVMGYNDDGYSDTHAGKWLSYAKSHYVTVKGKRVRLIDSAYFDDNWSAGYFREASHFSSPSVGCRYDDPVTGKTVESGVPTGTSSHDNARLLGLTYPLVANYRLHKDALLVSCSGKGSVTGGGFYVPGKKAKLAATPNSGYVFCGWYSDERMKKPLPGLWQEAAYSYTVPSGGATVYAKFRAKASEAAQKLKVSAGTDFVVVSPGGSLRLPLAIDAGCQPTVAAKGLPDGLSLSRMSGDGSWVIHGTPKEEGEWAVTVMVYTAARNDCVSATFDLLVGEWSGPTPVSITPRLRVGTGSYATLKDGSVNAVYKGVKQRIAISSPELSDKTDPFAVDGLPPGLSYADGAISGVPTACGSYLVRVAPRKSWKWKGSAKFTLKVKSLPAWAKGTFVGAAQCTNTLRSAVWRGGPATLTIGLTGRTSGKIQLNRGGAATFSFPYYTAQEDGSFVANGTAKVVKGGKTCKFAMALRVSGAADDAGIATLAMAGAANDPATTFGWDVVGAKLVQTRWTGADKALAAALKGQELTVFTKKSPSAKYRYKLTLKFGANGTAKAKYRAKDSTAGKWMPGTYSASGTAILLGGADGGYEAAVSLLLANPNRDFAEIRFDVSPKGMVSSPSAAVLPGGGFSE
ncbi:MAG: hypothetical protein J6T51_06715 [Kiritimatiellae bacterium]|nr:hypothetical protein [Kiritimatiellia bacterium]